MKQSKWLAIVFGLLVVMAFTVLRGSNGFVAKTIRNVTFDQYQRLSPRERTPQPVRVIDIDEASLAKIGQFPWPRNEFAHLVDELTKLGAATIVFDVIFSENDRLSPRRILNRDEFKELLDSKAAKDFIKKLPDNDKMFADSIAKAPVVLAFGNNPDGLSGEPVLKSGSAFTGTNTMDALHKTGRNTRLITILEKAATGIGSISIPTQDIIRKYPLIWSYKSNAYPSLVMEALRVAQGASTFVIRGADFEEQIVENIKIGAITIPTTRHGELWMYYGRNTKDLSIPAHIFLRGNAKEKAALRERIQGHIVFIGTSATGLFDMKTTTLSETVAGVSVHAQATEQILSQAFLWRPDWLNGVEILTVLFVGISIVFAATFLSPLASFAIGGVLSLILVTGSWFSFKQYGLLLDSSFPLFSGLLIHFAMTAYKYLITDKEARFVSMAFSRYVSPDVLQDIQTDPAALELGGDTRELTIMFVDIRNFTPLSEGLSPQDLVAFLNKLLGELSLCVTEQKGTIDKYIGDSIMAFWNAPLKVEYHEQRACLAALNMRKTLERLNKEDAFGFRKNGFDFGDIAIGIGINTGQACVGNLGSQERFDYSVIGDAVNVAARTESSCKELGTDILITASTAHGTSEFAHLDAGKIPLKGKTEDQQIFALVGGKKIKTSDSFQSLLQAHENLMADTAKSKISTTAGKCRKTAVTILPRLAGFYDRLSDRLITPPSRDNIAMGKKSS